MKDLMVDLETMGNKANAPITQIGAVYFDIKTGDTRDPYIVNIDLADSMKHGAVPSGDTIMWWLSQSDEARKGLTDGDIQYMKEETALRDFNRFAKGAKTIWSHATFDFVILMTSMERRNIKPTFHYRVARDIRTLTSLLDKEQREEGLRVGTHHNALDDAMHQIKYCCVAYKKLKGE